MKAKKYFDKEYGNDHIKDVVHLKDLESLYGLIQEYADKQLRLHSVSNPLSCVGCRYHNTTNDELCVTCGDTYKNKTT